MYKVLTKVLASLVAIIILLAPNQASAIDAVANYSVKQSYINPQMRVMYPDKSLSDIGPSVTCTEFGSQNCRAIAIGFYDNQGRSIQLKEGDIYQISFSFISRVDYRLLAYDPTDSVVISSDIATDSYAFPPGQIDPPGAVETYRQPATAISQYATFTIQATSDTNLNLGHDNLSIVFPLNLSDANPTTGLVIWRINSIQQLEPVDTSQQDEYYQDQNEGNDNIEGQDTSGTNQGVSDDDYASLLDIFSSFITALTNVSATNCVIDFDMGNVDLGNLDFCQLEPPSFIQVITSIILIVTFVPMGKALIERILRTIQELQR